MSQDSRTSPNSPTSLSAEYFRDVYAAADDPFMLDSKWYERRKYALTMASLPKPQYRRALEPGCSIGVLTEQLAARCEHVVSTDVVQSALDSARTRVQESAAVEFALWSLTDDWSALPDAKVPFDLIVVSEVGYYLDAADLASAMNRVVDHLEIGGTLVAAHWRHDVDDYPISGDRVHEIIAATPGLALLSRYLDEDVRIEVFVASDGPAVSVASTDGLDVR
ncbi:SAM-dependent methyltransferase [Rhodococcus sp. 06-412-2C]|uniref:class I SAM-dependent DNA methyltransferase n=1 Tax=unclassified Rhodococcus (in: high G+C Gram-positive bacteria) TaxID=192944 RepID=UPI000B9B605B|nr:MULTISPECIES: SAM-dependent methyltransferase [unclassified Rhodococcus (in: high G+C Gram-positive bacteria)]OZC89979.1 SAM-dependent methyltransferase [Rhodococcus sp. 06-412-2B]OZC94759.1 SAM-dependent methyltransferase [Rhodococcus sp. 06-412-2C]